MSRKNTVLGSLVFAALLLFAGLVVSAVQADEEPIRAHWETWPRSWGKVTLWSPEEAIGEVTWKVWAWEARSGFSLLGEYTDWALSGPNGEVTTVRWNHPTACGVSGSVKLTRYPGWGGGYAFGCVVATPRPPEPTRTPRPPTATPRPGEPTQTPAPPEPTPTPRPESTPWIPPMDTLCYGPGSVTTLGEAVRPGYVVVAEYRYYNGGLEGATIWEGVHRGLKGELKLLPGHRGLDWGFVALKAFPPSVEHDLTITGQPLGAHWKLYRVMGHFPPDYSRPILQLVNAGWADVIREDGIVVRDDQGFPLKSQHTVNCGELYFRVNNLNYPK